MPEKITILIADDHTLFRQGLRRVLELEPSFQVVGEAASADEVVRLAAELQPQVAIVDISMPGGGLSATGRLRALNADMGIVILTMHEDQEYLMEALRAGATAYLIKDVDAAEVAEAVRAARAGRPYLHPKLAGLALMEMARGGPVKPARAEGPPLTERELEVLRLVGRGATNREIAAALFISEKTAKNHLTHIFGKIGVTDRTHAALWAVREGLVSLKQQGEKGAPNPR